jgi:PIN domain nuclease of toxin-antitoxin system
VKRYLLDTHVVLWGLTAPRKLGRATLQILEHEAVYVSALSVWELLLKHDSGRLDLPQGRLIDAIERAGATLIPLLAEHAESAAAFGLMHGDPIDRMLVGTARAEQMILLTRDAQLLENAAPILGKLLLEA